MRWRWKTRTCRCRQEAIDAEAGLIFTIGRTHAETGAGIRMEVPVHCMDHGRRVAEALSKLIGEPAPGHDAGDCDEIEPASGPGTDEPR